MKLFSRHSRGVIRDAMSTLVALSGLLLSSTAFADAKPVDRAEAVRAARAHGPGLELASSATVASSDASRVASRLPFPARLSLSAGPRVGRGDTSLELGVTVMQELPPTGLMDARREVASSLGAAVRADIERARQDAVARASAAWVTAVEAREISKLREQAVREAERLVAMTQARLRGGVVSPVDEVAARGELGSARVALLDAEGALVDALAELRHAMGLEADAEIAAAGDLVAEELSSTNERPALSLAEQHPSVVAAQARARLARDDVRLTFRSLAPGWSIGASYLREGTGDHVVMGMLGIPLPTVSPGLLESSRQRAQADMAAAQVSLTKAQAERDLVIAAHDRVHSREVHRALIDGALSPMREAAALAQRQYEVGTSDVTPVLVARQRKLNAEERVVRALADILRADVRYARATGALDEKGSR